MLSGLILMRISQNLMINKVNDSVHYWIIGNVFPEQCSVYCVLYTGKQSTAQSVWS